MNRYILVNKKPVREPNLLKWADWMAKENKRIGYDKIDEILICTIFLGIDHRFGTGSPLLFETIVSHGEEYSELDELVRYETWDDAVQGHERWVKKVKGE